MRIIVSAPINSLSFGNVSVNILRELYKKQIDIAFFPIGDSVDLSAFDNAGPEFTAWLQEAIKRRYEKLDKNLPELKLWHLQGSETRLTKNRTLFTFHETSEPTSIEKILCNAQDKVVFSSSYSKNIFNEAGGITTPLFNVPIGFDPDFKKNNKKYFPDDRIHFGLMGKLEYRKNTTRIIKNWLELYGDNTKYMLSCAVHNPFLEESRFKGELLRALNGKQYNNINFIPHMKSNGDVCDYYNSVDVDLGGLSGGEGWNLPSFNLTSLGKWGAVLNATSHTDWATAKNSILVEPSGKKVCHDGIFFKSGEAFNQGYFYDLTDEEMKKAIVLSEKYAKKPNPEGEKLQKEFTYSNTVDKLLQIIQS